MIKTLLLVWAFAIFSCYLGIFISIRKTQKEIHMILMQLYGIERKLDGIFAREAAEDALKGEQDG